MIENKVLEIPDELNPNLQNLLMGMLQKDTSARLSLDQVRSHLWTTDGTRLRNLSNPQDLRPIVVSEEEKDAAFTPLNNLHMIFQLEIMTDKWKKKALRRTSSKSSSYSLFEKVLSPGSIVDFSSTA